MFFFDVFSECDNSLFRNLYFDVKSRFFYYAKLGVLVFLTVVERNRSPSGGLVPVKSKTVTCQYSLKVT